VQYAIQCVNYPTTEEEENLVGTRTRSRRYQSTESRHSQHLNQNIARELETELDFIRMRIEEFGAGINRDKYCITASTKATRVSCGINLIHS
jgi:hypothetical protein